MRLHAVEVLFVLREQCAVIRVLRNFVGCVAYFDTLYMFIFDDDGRFFRFLLRGFGEVSTTRLAVSALTATKRL